MVAFAFHALPHRSAESDRETTAAHSRRRDNYSSTDSSGEEDTRTRESKNRSRKLRRVDLSNPLSMYQRQTSHKKSYIEPSLFIKNEWFKLRGLNDEGKFIVMDDNKTDSWKSVTLADKLIK